MVQGSTDLQLHHHSTRVVVQRCNRNDGCGSNHIGKKWGRGEAGRGEAKPLEEEEPGEGSTAPRGEANRKHKEPQWPGWFQWSSQGVHLHRARAMASLVC